jgi:uncharacterized membrane protein YeaQ/YmgE (transglycosylase-associated protein family)
MEFLRHPLYSILAVIVIGVLSGALAQLAHRSRTLRGWSIALLAGIGAAFIGFHFAMLANVATGVILMPFAVALVISLAVSFALRDATR